MPGDDEALKDLIRSRIEATPGVLGGKPRVAGTRLGVAFLLELLSGEWTFASIREEYPRLQDADLRACLAYAARSVERGAAERVTG